MRESSRGGEVGGKNRRTLYEPSNEADSVSNPIGNSLSVTSGNTGM